MTSSGSVALARQDAEEKEQHRQTAPVQFRHDLVKRDADQRPATGSASAGSSGDSGPELLGRRSECDVLDRLLESVRAGQGEVLVLRGESGVGKSALLEYLVGKARGFRIVRAAGTECEMELAFAGLHQLCAPMLDRLSALPAPQRDALASVFGLNGHEAPDRF
ncbi:MAG TPA: ATP-binding protein, partial [Chloroflexota bacterium]